MPIGLGIMQIGRIDVYTTITTLLSVNPEDGYAFCNSSPSFLINVENTMAPRASTSINARSDGYTLPTDTIFVNSTEGFPRTGQIFIERINTLVTYTDIISNAFIGCSDGYGTLASSQAVTSGPFPPQGSVYIQDTRTGIIPSSGIGSLLPIDRSNSRVTISPILPIGTHNLSMHYIGQEGDSYDLNHQFKASQSNSISYPVAQIVTSLSISGPSTFSVTAPQTYSISFTPADMSVGTIIALAQQEDGYVMLLSSSSPSRSVTAIIPANTFTTRNPVTLTVNYIDLEDRCYKPSSATIVITPI